MSSYIKASVSFGDCFLLDISISNIHFPGDNLDSAVNFKSKDMRFSDYAFLSENVIPRVVALSRMSPDSRDVNHGAILERRLNASRFTSEVLYSISHYVLSINSY